MLDPVMIEQLRTYFKNLKSEFVLDVTVSPKHPKRTELLELMDDIAKCSPKISYNVQDGNGLQFIIMKDGASTRIKFRSTPNGHEFSSLILAILNSDGQGMNLPDEETIKRIKALKGPISLTTYVSLTCLTCSELVQTLNAMTTYNDRISHEIVDGGINKMEVIEKHLDGLPTVFADGEIFLIGRAGFVDITTKLENKYGKSN